MDAPQHDATHHHDMPEWGRVLWNRYWHIQAALDRLDQKMADYAQAAADAEAELSLIPGLVQQVADLQAALAANDPAAVQAAADALEAAVQQAQAATNPPAPAPAPADPNQPPA